MSSLEDPDEESAFLLDDVGPSTAPHESLDWRLDRAENQSDWTIEVVVLDGDCPAVTEYHVHRCMLTVGTRKSGYFKALFQSQADFQETTTRTSQLKLHQVAADAFPAMLDYIYHSDSRKPLEIVSSSATALHFLGVYLDIASLCHDAKDFILQDLSLLNCHVYYKDSVVLQNKAVLGAVKRLCAATFLEIQPSDDPIVVAADADFWISVISKYALSKPVSLHASRMVGSVCNRIDVDLDTFLQLTDATRMPHIHLSATVSLLKVESRLMGDQQEVSGLTCLQERCIDSLSSDCQCICKDQELAGFLDNQSPPFLSKLLRTSVSSAALEKKKLLGSMETYILSAHNNWISAQAYDNGYSNYSYSPEAHFNSPFNGILKMLNDWKAV
jgi:hypothetical protein